MRDIQRNIQNMIDRTIRQLAYRNYYSAKAYHHFRPHLSSIGRKDQLVVYQMGKVGSTTIVRSLEALGLDTSIYHIHYLTEYYLDINEEKQKSDLSPKNVHRCKLLWESQFLRRQLDRGLRGKKWRVVTLKRIVHE